MISLPSIFFPYFLQLAVERAAINRSTSIARLSLNATLPLLASDLSRCCAEALSELLDFDAVTPQNSASRKLLEASLQNFYRAESFLPQQVLVTSTPVFSYTANAYFGVVKSFFALIVVLAFLVPLGRFVRVAVWEREVGLADALRAAGIPMAPLLWAWPCVYAGVICSAGILCGILIGTTIFSGGSTFILVLLFILFGLCCVAWGMVLMAVCSRTKTASLGGMLSW